MEVISEFGGGWFITLLHAWIDKGSNNEWRFTGFFGELDTSRRIEAWDSFRNLNHYPNVPWLCAGDFNEHT